MTIKETIDKVLAILRKAAEAATGSDKATLEKNIDKLQSTRLTLESNLEGRTARENGERQKILQNHAKAIDILQKHGPTLSTPQKQADAAKLANQLEVFPKPTVDKLADFLAKGLEAEWLETSLILLKGLAELDTLGPAGQEELESIRVTAVRLSVEATLDKAELDEYRNIMEEMAAIMSFLSVGVAADPEVKPLEVAMQINKFSNDWQTDFLTPMMRSLLAATTPEYEQLRTSLEKVSKDLNAKLKDLVDLVQSIKALNEFLGFFSKILTFAIG